MAFLAKGGYRHDMANGTAIGATPGVWWRGMWKGIGLAEGDDALVVDSLTVRESSHLDIVQQLRHVGEAVVYVGLRQSRHPQQKRWKVSHATCTPRRSCLV